MSMSTHSQQCFKQKEAISNPQSVFVILDSLFFPTTQSHYCNWKS